MKNLHSWSYIHCTVWECGKFVLIRTVWCSRYKGFFLTYYLNTMQQKIVYLFQIASMGLNSISDHRWYPNVVSTKEWQTIETQLSISQDSCSYQILRPSEIFTVQTHSNMESVWLLFMIKIQKAVNSDVIYSCTCCLKAYCILIFIYFVPSHTGSVVGRCFQWWRIHVSQFWCLIWRNVG